MKTKYLSTITKIIGSFCIAGVLTVCGQTTTKESALIGSWQTINGPQTTYTFQDNHALTMTYKGGTVLSNASIIGHWKLDSGQLTIVRDKYIANGREMPSSKKDDAVTWIIVSVADSAMTWSNATQRIELRLSRIKS